MPFNTYSNLMKGGIILPIKQLAYITERNNNVTVLDISNNTVIANIPVGLNAAGIAFTPDKSRAYVTNAD